MPIVNPGLVRWVATAVAALAAHLLLESGDSILLEDGSLLLSE